MVVKRDFLYTPKGKDRMLHIWLPDNYNETDERYPVLYFFDGHNLFFNEDATFGKSWGFCEFLQQWPRDIIIVGIECGHEGDERLSEYSPFRTKTGFLSRFAPMGDITMQWIVHEIKPMIDREYRTLADRLHTGIGGSSMGGLMSVYAIARYNDVFSKAACVSSSIMFCLPRILGVIDTCKIDPDTRVYLSWGTREARGVKDPDAEDRTSFTYKSLKAAASRFASSGAKTMLNCQIGGHHCEADWEKQIPTFMNFLWQG